MRISYMLNIENCWEFQKFDSERGINTKALCANVSSRQHKYHMSYFIFQIAEIRKHLLALCKANVAKATIVSACFH